MFLLTRCVRNRVGKSKDIDLQSVVITTGGATTFRIDFMLINIPTAIIITVKAGTKPLSKIYHTKHSEK